MKTLICSCGAVWPWERFKVNELSDCPHCNPDDWSLAINLASNVKPIEFVDPITGARTAGPE